MAGPSSDRAFLNPGPGASQRTAHPALGTTGNAARERFQSQLPEARRARRPRSQSLSSLPDVQPWANFSTSLSLRHLICKTVTKHLQHQTRQGSCEKQIESKSNLKTIKLDKLLQSWGVGAVKYFHIKYFFLQKWSSGLITSYNFTADMRNS